MSRRSEPRYTQISFGGMSEAAQRRFEFLFPATQADSDPIFELHRPDILETRWSVFEKRSKRTVSYGRTAAEATDAAIASLRHAQDHAVGWPAGTLFNS